MTSAEIALAAFALCNSVRVFAYVPQIVAVARDPGGASAISYTTWVLFAVSHLSTVAYAALVVDDWRMAAVFIANTVCCLTIVAVTAWKRALYKAAKRLIASTDHSALLDHAPAVQANEEQRRKRSMRADHSRLLVVAGGRDVAAQPRVSA